MAMSKSSPLISIVVPNYNCGIFIEQTLVSILCQSFDDYELLVLDAGSEDMSLPILSRYSDRFSYFRCGKDDGHYSSLNEGFSNAKGEVLLWLNSDDILHTGALRSIAQTYLESSSSYELFTGFPTLLDSSGRIKKIYYKKFNWSLEHFLSINPYSEAHYMQQESTFFTKKLWDRVGGLRWDKFPLAADFDLWIRMAQHTNILEVQKLIGGFRSHGNNRSINVEQYAREVAWSQEELRSSRYTNCLAARGSASGLHIKSTIHDDCSGTRSYSLSRIKLFTSLAPKNLDVQKDCVLNWIANGFDAVSLNGKWEVSKLSEAISEIEYQQPRFTLESIYGKPYVSLTSFVEACSQIKGISGIINSDIRFLMQRSFESIAADVILHKAKKQPSLILFSRLEIGSFVSQVSSELADLGLQPFLHGDVYSYGFDLMLACQDTWMLLGKHLRDDLPLGMGVPWWDYYIPSLAQKLNIKVFIVHPTPIGHLYHEAVYSKEMWISSSRPILELLFNQEDSEDAKRVDQIISSPSRLEVAARQIIKTIHFNAEEISFGQYINPYGMKKFVERYDDSNHLSFLAYETFARTVFT